MLSEELNKIRNDYHRWVGTIGKKYIERLFEEIDLLVKENEELKDDKKDITAIADNTQAHWGESYIMIQELQSRLDAIEKAAEPFVSLMCKGDYSLPDDFIIYYDSDKTSITVGDVRRLNKAVKEAK